LHQAVKLTLPSASETLSTPSLATVSEPLFASVVRIQPRFILLLYTPDVDRLVALLLTVLISSPLITPLLAQQPEQQLPACCRRDGKHACGMRKAPPPSTPGSTLRSQAARCPLFPTDKSVPASTKFGTPVASIAVWASAEPSDDVVLFSERSGMSPTSRSESKRGPPADGRA
jgi:hypothetical protein